MAVIFPNSHEETAQAINAVATRLGDSLLVQDRSIRTLSSTIDVLAAMVQRLEKRVDELEARWR